MDRERERAREREKERESEWVSDWVMACRSERVPGAHRQHGNTSSSPVA